MNIPAEADAVFLLPDSLMGTPLTEMVTAVTNRNQRTSVSHISAVKEYDRMTPKDQEKMAPPIRILHLEDDPADMALVQAKLTEAGLVGHITHTQTRAEFENALLDKGTDIILADYRLPGYDGMSALGLARELRPDVPFIFVSGAMGEEAAIEALTQGATDYVLKHKLSRLAPAVERALQEVRTRRERRQAQEALQRSNDLLRAIIEAAPVAIIGLDLDGHVHSVWNPAAEKMLGWRSREVMGRPLPNATADRQEEFSELRDKIRSGMILDGVEVRRQRRDGTPIDYSIYASPLHDAQGRISGNIAVLVDITQRKQAEGALRASEARYIDLYDNAPDMYASLDAQSALIEKCNRTLADTLGCSKEEIIGRPVFDIYHPDCLDEAKAAFQEFLERGEIHDKELQLRKRDGSKLDVSLNASAVRAADGTIVFSRSTLRDITDYKQAEEEIRKLNATLEQRVAKRTAELKNRTQQLQKLALELSGAEDRERRHIASILHDDFQQQLAYIKMELDQVRKKADTIVGPRLGLLSEITDEYIEKSRNLSYELNPPALYRRGLLAALEMLAKDMEKRQGLVVTVRKQKGAEPTSLSLASILYRSARELLYNVVKHAGVESALLDIRDENGLIYLKVEDCGNGFDFDAVRVTQDSGAGFGLYSIEDRMTFLGGFMKVETKPGEGCCVVLAVPKDLALKTAVAEMPPECTVEGFAGDVPAVPIYQMVGREQIRVLLADDHQLMREALAKLLQGHKGLAVVGQAVDGNEAVKLAAKLKPHVILMDVTMPELGGFEATAQITGIYPHIRIIGLSMHNDPGTRRKMFDAGASAYLTKTDPSDTLVETIRRVYHGIR